MYTARVYGEYGTIIFISAFAYFVTEYGVILDALRLIFDPEGVRLGKGYHRNEHDNQKGK